MNLLNNTMSLKVPTLLIFKRFIFKSLKNSEKRFYNVTNFNEL
jgi:hypothetical protein